MGKLLAIGGLGLGLFLVAGIGTPETQAAAPLPRPLTLDEVLNRWAESNDSMRSMRYRFTRTQRNRNFGTIIVTKGQVRSLRPDLLRIDEETWKERNIVSWNFGTLTVKDGEVRWLESDPQRIEQETPKERSNILFTKDHIHTYYSADKTERVFSKPADRGFLAEKPGRASGKRGSRRFLDFRFEEMFQHWLYAGLPAQELSPRFDPQLAKEDAWYVYLDLLPPESARGTFTRMRVVLRKTTLRVRLIWYEEPNGNEVTIDFEKFEANPTMTPEDVREGLPKAWKRIDIPKAIREIDPRPKE